MGPLILDPSVLIGHLDSADAHHATSVADVETADRAGKLLVTPASAYSEALVAFARANRVAEARDVIHAMGISVALMTSSVAERAAELRARHDGLRLPGAIVLATALDLHGTLFTYDERLRRVAADRPS